MINVTYFMMRTNSKWCDRNSKTIMIIGTDDRIDHNSNRDLAA